MTVHEFVDLCVKAAESAGFPSAAERIKQAGSSYALADDAELDDIDRFDIIVKIEDMMQGVSEALMEIPYGTESTLGGIYGHLPAE